MIHERRLTEALRVCQCISRSTFEEHCYRYVRELLYFFSSNQHIDNESGNPLEHDPYETHHVFDTNTISLIYFIDYFEQYPSNTRHLSIDTLFYCLFKSYEKMNRLDEFTKFMRDHSSKYIGYLSSKTKDAFSQADITLPIKSLSSPRQSRKQMNQRESFFNNSNYEEDSHIGNQIQQF